MSHRRRFRCVLAAGLLLLPTGCVTPRPVTDLAATAARNASLLEGQLSGLARQQQAISDSRILILSRLNRETVEATAHRERLAAFEREGGLGAPVKLYEDFRRRAEESAREHVQRAEALAAARKKLDDTQKAVQAPTAPLQDTAKALLAVSRELSFKEHVKFLFGFFSEVGSDVKKAQENAKKAKADGDAKAKKAEDTAKDTP